ncbi:hypothetical protein AVEN_194544-1 [Araneus ventricosus]|uniref:Uncharacterized protein n=1 Tax=Araneus ventricosus TaxID=182803 RepID=A0A4Y2A7K2_ARAVE|nr:hypothetical protein AVEN_194544-1 [Araneus ventricosus]
MRQKEEKEETEQILNLLLRNFFTRQKEKSLLEISRQLYRVTKCLPSPYFADRSDDGCPIFARNALFCGLITEKVLRFYVEQNLKLLSQTGFWIRMLTSPSV